MSRFRKLIEDIINRELLNADDAIKANEFATEVLREFFNKLDRIVFNQLHNIGSEIVFDIKAPNSHNILTFHLFIGAPVDYGKYNRRDGHIVILLQDFYSLLYTDYIADRVRHEVIHYYDDFIAQRGLIKTYGDLNDIKANPGRYVRSDNEVSAYYTGACNFVYRNILYYLQYDHKLGLTSKSFLDNYNRAFNRICSEPTQPLNSAFRYYTQEEKEILYNAIKEYVLKVMEKENV